MKKLYVIVLHYSGRENTIECLKSLVKSRVPQGFSFTFVVVDNNSVDNLGSGIKKEFPGLVLIQNKKNLGYSGGNNVGIKYALSQGAEYVLLLNNDTIVQRDSAFELIMALREKDGDVVCPKIYFEKGFEYHKDNYSQKDLGKVFWFAGAQMDWKNVIGFHTGVDEVDRGQYDSQVEIEFITGACFLVKAEVFKNVGVFDDSFFLYYEDADLSMRIKKQNYKIIFASKSIIYHKNAGSSGSGSPLQDYYITRNRLLFGLRYAPLRARVALIKEGLRIIMRGRKWQKKGVIDYFTHNLGKGSYKSV